MKSESLSDRGASSRNMSSKACEREREGEITAGRRNILEIEGWGERGIGGGREGDRGRQREK